MIVIWTCITLFLQQASQGSLLLVRSLVPRDEIHEARRTAHIDQNVLSWRRNQCQRVSIHMTWQFQKSTNNNAYQIISRQDILYCSKYKDTRCRSIENLKLIS